MSDIWISADGRQTPVRLLSDKHLLNIFHGLTDVGDMSDAEKEMLGISDSKNWYLIIKQEVERRGLEIED